MTEFWADPKWQISCRIPISIRAGRYLVKTADCREDLVKALELRHQVFYLDGPGISPKGALDWDDFDRIADHLVVYDTTTARVVGTYRLISSNHSHHFESANFFKIEPLLKRPLAKLEMSCACVDKRERGGTVIALLWRGLRKYLELDQTDIVFGMTSLFESKENALSTLFSQLREAGHLSQTYMCDPQSGSEITMGKPMQAIPVSPHELLRDLPPLFRAYLRAGATVASPPVLDPELGCFHFFMILEMNNCAQKINHHFTSRTAVQTSDTHSI